MIDFRHAEMDDIAYLAAHDPHIRRSVLSDKILKGQIIVVCVGKVVKGFIRYGYFWDHIPFMNLLYIEEDLRHQGLGTSLVAHWEKLMLDQGHQLVLISSMAHESAQYFYRKCGYLDCGNLCIEEEGMELLFKKELGKEA